MRESDLLQHIYQASQSLPPSVLTGPGDDMAVMQLGSERVLMTVDQVADGVHVNTQTTALELVGRKAIVRNLSDVAAMAAKPLGAVAAACLPRDFGEANTHALFDAMRATAEQYDCPLVGGDIAMWDGKLLLTVTVFAEPAGIEPVLRSGAKPGDRIYVTGELGGAWDDTGGGPHLGAEPRIAIARALASNPEVCISAMIDLSDGLATDLSHICQASGVGAVIDESSLPCRIGVDTKGALTDGEDYELCFTAAGDLPGEQLGVPITAIGECVADDKHQVQLRAAGGALRAPSEYGWEHHGG